MKKQILYPSIISRLFSNVLDFLIVAVISSPIVNFISKNTITVFLSQFFIDKNIEVTDHNSLLRAMQTHEFTSQYGAELLAYILFMILINALILAVYFLFFWYKFSTTPGKFILNMKISNLEGGKINGYEAIKRLAFSSFALIGFWFLVFNKKRQSLHDLVAKTVVIRK